VAAAQLENEQNRTPLGTTRFGSGLSGTILYFYLLGHGLPDVLI
jgi:hypothetical protein